MTPLSSFCDSVNVEMRFKTRLMERGFNMTIADTVTVTTIFYIFDITVVSK